MQSTYVDQILPEGSTITEKPNTKMGLYGLPVLQHRQIRLLRIGIDSRTRDIRCTISVHDLYDETQTLDFSALSYTWGSCHQGQCSLRRPLACITPSNAVFCNDEQVEVTENLFDFLHHWASNHETSAYIWIDALCIDQHNIPEQSHQVNIMGQIYTAASQVLVWLGPEDDSTDLAFSFMEQLSLLEPETRSALHPHEVSTQNANPLLDLARWRALSHLFSRTWFSRVWIIQEAIFAKRCIVLCGSYSMPWETLVNVSRFLATSNWMTYFKDPARVEDYANKWCNTPARLAAQHKTWRGSYRDALLYALIRARPSVCQDPRDKVYSQLHLGQADIFPDYNRSVSEVFAIAAEYILRQSGSMLLLTCVEGEDFQTPAYKLPTWVPDWSVRNFVGLRITGYRHFHAVRKRPPKYSISQNKRMLEVEAMKLDDVVGTCEKKENLRANLHTSTLWQLISMLDLTYATIHGTQSCGEVVWRTLMINRGSTPSDRKVRYPAPESLEQSFRNWILWRYAVATEEPTAFPMCSANDSILPSQEELEEVRKEAARDSVHLATLTRQAAIFDLHYSYAMHQRPFRTKQGYFGIGTQCLRKGDSVWIISGCRVPIILRRVEGSERYQLVGGAYLHGFMDGEALDREEVHFEMVKLE